MCYDVFLGIVNKVYLNSLHYQEMIEKGNSPRPEEIGFLVDEYDKANKMWNHIGSLKVS